MAPVAPELQQGWTSAWVPCPTGASLPLPEVRPVSLPAQAGAEPASTSIWSSTGCASAMSNLLAEQGIQLEVRTPGLRPLGEREDEDVDLWFGTLNLEHEHAFALTPGCRAPLLRQVWGGQQAPVAGIDAVARHGEEPGPAPCWPRCSARAGSCRCFTTGWSWRAGSACTGADDGLGWFDFRSAWLRPGGAGAGNRRQWLEGRDA